MGFEILSARGINGLPLVAFRLDPDFEHLYDEYAIAHQLRERGWVIPAYTMAPHSNKMKLMRIVVREDFSRSRCDALLVDIKFALNTLDQMDAKRVKDHYEYDFLCIFILGSISSFFPAIRLFNLIRTCSSNTLPIIIHVTIEIRLF